MRVTLPVLLLAALVAAAQAGAQEAAPPGQDGLAFADSLCEAGDYFRAIGEYKRLLYLEAVSAGRIKLHLAACYARAGGYQEAADLLSELSGGEGPEAEPALFELGLVYYLAGLNVRAAETFERFAGRYPLSPKAEEALTLSGLARLAGAEYAKAERLLEALKTPCAAELVRAAREPALPERSPLLAGLLSAALPGTGQLYCGRPAQAAASLLLTGAAVFGAWAALSNDYEGAGTLAAIVAATLYAGSIRSAATCAAEINREARRGWLSGLARRCNLSLVPGGVAFSY